MTKDELKILRKLLGFTQKQMGEKLGISHSAIVKLETGENNMSKPVAILLANLQQNSPTSN